jgi:hypothetical protein
MENRLKLSVAKTKCTLLKKAQLKFGKAVSGKFRMPVRRPESQRAPTIKMKGQPIGYVKEFRYLGFILDEKLSFESHLKYVAEKATKIFYKVRRVAQANWGLGFKTLKTLYSGVLENLFCCLEPLFGQKK